MDNITLTRELDPRRQAMYLYWQGLQVARIAEILGIKATTLHSWKRRDQWDQYGVLEKMQLTTATRYCQLVAIEAKSGRDFKELDALGRQAERHARIGKYNNGGNEADLDPNRAALPRGKRKVSVKNVFSDEQISQLATLFQASLFAYQRAWYQAGLDDRFRLRNLLKSRQIGATFYFAREALLDALTTARNQMFISASKAQAHQFKHYIVDFAAEVGVELRGDPICLPNGAELHFLGTNTNTAQGRSGCLYVDEYFWIPGFKKLRRAASGMASQKRYRQTYFSTPSSVNHEAYPFWNGTLFNQGREKNQRIEVDTSYPHLAAGALCADGQYKQIVTLEDALAGGCDRFDIAQLRRENSDDDFDNLFMCQFIDDAQSVFPMKEMQRCMVDSWEQWPDVKLLATRPYGYQPVWIGYDPASTGDASGCAVMAPPKVAGGKFRVLERFQWHGMDFSEQARHIQTLTERYNVSYIGIDDTGLGRSVTQLVRQFFPAVQAIHYTVEMKTDLIYKAKDVITSGRLEFDAGAMDIAKAFMSIRKTLSASGQRATYVTNRAEGTSHGDVAWAIMHALFNEPLAGITVNNSSFMEPF
ncbi:terminase large subunit domain-containing protein [Candidatus Fukatsuia endosymbiont of Tuberolachnus salignus]|uniref:terminase large subunit domain-containing protein n=1 Tax=Candidatus Fukatsuia endosymbiont of Tuberolachnus salignus TaxID=3077957 RepID=UPI00313BD6C2